MHSIRGVVLAGILIGTAQAADTGQELESMQAELKPLRVKAYAESDVKAARKKLDAAYRAYWDAVRAAMKRLDPSKADLIDRDVELRKEKPAVAGAEKSAAVD